MTSLLSKKRYHEIKDMLCEYVDDDDIEEIMTKFRDIMNFDLEKKTCTKERNKKFMEWRKNRAKELNITIGQYNRGEY